MGKNTIVKDTLILLAITLIAGLLLGGVYSMTKDPIAAQELKAKTEAYAKVYPGGDISDEAANAALAEALAGFTPDDGDAVITEALCVNGGEGFVFSCNAKGYGGPVNIALGVKSDMTITGMSVLSMSETPGLGAKCLEDDFQAQFKDIQKESIVINEDYQQISGATITSKACMRAINAALKFVAENAK